MLGGSGVAELQHVAEHGEPPARPGVHCEHGERRGYRGRRGVVTLVEENSLAAGKSEPRARATPGECGEVRERGGGGVRRNSQRGRGGEGGERVARHVQPGRGKAEADGLARERGGDSGAGAVGIGGEEAGVGFAGLAEGDDGAAGRDAREEAGEERRVAAGRMAVPSGSRPARRGSLLVGDGLEARRNFR